MQTDVIIKDAVDFCNELCEKYKDLSKKERLHTEQMIFPRAAFYLQMIKYISSEESLSLIGESVRIGVEPDRVFGDMSGITFERQGALERCFDRCDFYFYREK